MHTTLPGNPLPVLYVSNHIALVLCQVNIYGMRALNFESNRYLLLSTLELMTSCISVSGWETQAARPGSLQESLWPCSSPLFCRKDRRPMIHRILGILMLIHGSRGMTLKILNISISLFFHGVLLRLLFLSLFILFTEVLHSTLSPHWHIYTSREKKHPLCTTAR